MSILSQHVLLLNQEIYVPLGETGFYYLEKSYKVKFSIKSGLN